VAVNLASHHAADQRHGPAWTAVAKAAARAGAEASWRQCGLSEAVRSEQFLPVLEEHFPTYLRRYRELRAQRLSARRLPDMIRERIDRIRNRYNLRPRETVAPSPSWCRKILK